MAVNFKFPYSMVKNSAYLGKSDYVAAAKAIINIESFKRAKEVITSWPGYAPTPVNSLDGLAREVGVGKIFYKDEAPRFGLNSFKGLGGPYAVFRLLEDKIKAATGAAAISAKDVLEGKYKDIVSQVTVTTATDGNHGRAVAWGAQVFGCKCVIYIHSLVSEGRKKEIEKYGAEVIRITGNYDDSVRQAQDDANKYGRFVISDTSYEGYSEPPTNVMQGYTLMVDEVLAQLPKGTKPTHIFIQGGVGAMAAGIIAHFWELWGKESPQFVIVEPDKADCLLQSAKAGKPVTVHGKLDTIMAGLACGEVSLLAWAILQPSCSHFMSITDDAAMETMRVLARGENGDQPIVAGESAVGGLAGLLNICKNPADMAELGLNKDSCVLIFGSEGDSDPALYQQIVGRSSSEVRAGKAKAA